MNVSYDKQYQTENLFGEPYSERGRLLDLGCGQGRNAIPLAQLGYEVTGMDISNRT